MKYIVQIEVDPETGVDIEGSPEKIHELMEKWQTLNPIGLYFSLTRRAITVIVDVANEDAMFEALHATWVVAKDYPDVSPVVSAEESPAIMQRLGMR